MSAAYPQLVEGEPSEVPIGSDLFIMCCDCGLVHRHRFRIFGRGREMTVRQRIWRAERATAAARRGKSFKGLRLPKAACP